MNQLASLSPHLAFGCLIAALLMALSMRIRRASLIPGCMAISLGYAGGLIAPAALPALGLAAALLVAQHAWHPRPVWAGRLIITLLALWALAAALHMLPGFSPWLLMHDFGRLANRTLAWHFDKGLAALVLLCSLPAPADARTHPQHWLFVLPGCAALLGFALLGGLAQIDPRWLPASLIWLIGNLFLTVFAEEVFFRGLIQRSLHQAIHAHRHAFGLAVSVSALLFGAVHLPWGLPFAGMATLAGVFYGLMAGPESNLPRAITAHALLNALTLTLLDSPLA